MRSCLRYWRLVLRMALAESRATVVRAAGSSRRAIIVLLVGSAIVFAPPLLGWGSLLGLAIIVAGALLAFAWKVASIPPRLYWRNRSDEAAREAVRMVDAQLRTGQDLYERTLRSVGLDLEDELVGQCDEWCRQTEALLARGNEEERHAFSTVDAEERARIVEGSFTYQGVRRIDLRRSAMKKRLDNLRLIAARRGDGAGVEQDRFAQGPETNET